jgi:hypothetical protein
MYEQYEQYIKPHAGKLYERIAMQHELRHGTEQQREIYRRAINIMRGIRKAKTVAA